MSRERLIKINIMFHFNESSEISTVACMVLHSHNKGMSSRWAQVTAFYSIDHMEKKIAEKKFEGKLYVLYGVWQMAMR